jgi:hypothetical protein
VSESGVVFQLLVLSSYVMPKELSIASSGDNEEVGVMSALFSSVVMKRVSF